jgi:Zn-dependent protease with chaperone function
MGAILVYLLKANLALALFVAAYYGLLRRLTFLRANRAYLLVALGLAAGYPALPVPALLPAPVATYVPSTAFSGGPRITLIENALAPTAASTPAFDWLLVAGALYGAGALLLLLRLLGQLVSLGLVWRRSRLGVAQGQTVHVLPGEGGAFSFGGAIFLSSTTLRAEPTTLAALLRHEQAHVRQGHTLDVLLVQVAVAVAWANPAAWLLRRAVLDNLEYLADEAALQTGLDRRTYQYSLLQLLPLAVPAPALAFHLSSLTLKNRIHMLNQPHSSTRQLGRYLLAGPLVLALALGLAGARAKSAPAPLPAAKPAASPQPAAPQLTALAALASVATPASALPATTPATSHRQPTEIAALPAVQAALQLPAASPQAMPLPAQTGPGLPADALYYLDGKPSTKATVDALDKETIASIDIVKGKETVQRLKPGSTATAVVVFTTKANANSPAVLALAEQGDLGAAYEYKKIETNAIPLQTLAYIVAHYPNDRLVELQEVKKKSTGVVARYMVMLARGRRPFFVNLTPTGGFISDTTGS